MFIFAYICIYFIQTLPNNEFLIFSGYTINSKQKISTNYTFGDVMSIEKDDIGIFSPSVLVHVEDLQKMFPKLEDALSNLK